MIHNPIIVGESTKGLMRFTARVSYTGSALNKNTLDISASGSELLLLTDKDGRTQIVNPFYVNDVPYVFVTAASARYKIIYCNTWVQISTGMLNFALTKIQLGTLETL